MFHEDIEYFREHGCLIWIHMGADLVTFFGCVLIAITGAYIYRRGRFAGLEITYPGLWTAGAAFIFCLGAIRAMSVIEMVFGGILWYMAGMKVCTAGCCGWFAVSLWKAKDEMVQIGTILNAISRGKQEEEGG
jgi:hypothetical protein